MVESLFCKLYLIWKENDQIYVENKHSYGILTIEPYFAGQGIIIPKRHIKNNSELTPEEAKDYFHLVDLFHQKILMNYESSNLDLEKFYKKLFQNPTTPKSKELSRIILESKELYEKPEGFNIGMDYGICAGQNINHSHINYIPRRESDISKSGIGAAFISLLKK